jgi:ABC-2 type transport system permease protein
MNCTWIVAANEWRLMRRSRVVQIALLMITALSAIAAFTSIAHRDNSDAVRSRFQAMADQSFDGQPARHPHRVVHYGHFVFRPLPALAAFDPGVDAFTGSTIFLEGHRQNSANFGDVRQSSLLARFGQLTPAFVLQVLAPLVLVFVGFAMVARERESGILRLLAAHGVTARTLITGKAIALGGIAALMLVPALLALLWLIAAEGASLFAVSGLVLAYIAYIASWVLIIVIISSLARVSRTALITLLGLWSVAVILIPRVAPDVAIAATPLATRLETDIAIQRDLREIGDSHDADDPHFAAFKARVLRQYGVSRVEDLPVNYRGLLAIEGEKLTSRLFDAYSERQFAQQRQQSATVTGFGFFSPTIALRSLSMTLSGTDLEGHRRFLQQAEAYRFDIVQRLNRLQAEAVTFTDDGNRNKNPEAARRVRIDPSHWGDVPDFTFRGPTSGEKVASALPGAMLMLAWLVALGCALTLTIRRVGSTL